MTWTWKWNTVCQATRPHELRRFTPSASRRSFTRTAIALASCMTASRSSSGMLRRSSEWARGITSRWPRVAGEMSMNATVRSSSATIVAGASPAAMAQKMQSSLTARQRIQPRRPADRPRRPPARPLYSAAPMTDALAPPTDVLREVVEALAPLRRNPGSEGEREAAEWIARRLGEAGADPRIETEEVGSTFYLPIGVHSALGAAAGVASLLGGRRL